MVAATLLLLGSVLIGVAARIWNAARTGQPLPIHLGKLSRLAYSIASKVRPQAGLLALLPARAPPTVLAYQRTNPPRLRYPQPE